MRILVPTDGSPRALKALRFVVENLAREMTTLELELLNVQPPLPSAVTSFVAGETVRSFHKEEGDKALAGAVKLLADAGLRHETHVAIGEPAQTIADYAGQKGCSLIVMGSRGLGAMDLLLGSTARKVLHLARIPVTFVP